MSIFLACSSFFECSRLLFMLSDICCRFVEHIHEGLLAFRALLPSLHPEGRKDTRVQLCDSWLDCRDKRTQINLHPSKWVPVTVEIKRFWLASQMTDVSVLFPPQWPVDKPRIRERETLLDCCHHTCIHTQKCISLNPWVWCVLANTDRFQTHWIHSGIYRNSRHTWHLYSPSEYI